MKKSVVALALLATLATAPVMTVAAAQAAPSSASLGDLSSFVTIANDTLALVGKNDLTAAQARITDFETAWDKAEPTLYPRNHDRWSVVDEAADAAISALRSKTPTQRDAAAAVSGLIMALRAP